MRMEKGFTIIELLLVVGIISILAVIAIPQFAEYRTNGFNAQAQVDLSNGRNAQEAYFADHNVYLTCANADCEGDAGGLPGLELTSGVGFYMRSVNSDREFYVRTKHIAGDTCFSWFSYAGNPDDATPGVMAASAGVCP